MNRLQSLLPIIALVGVLLTAPYNPAGANLEEEIDFIDRLASEGYLNLARHAINQIEEDPNASENLKQYTGVLRANILKIEANRDPNPENRIETFNQVIDRLDEFINTSEGHPLWGEALFELGHTLRRQGQNHANLYSQVSSERQSDVLSSGRSAFDRAVEIYDRAGRHFTEREGDNTSGLMRAQFFKPVAQYEKARLLQEAGEMEEMASILEETIDLIEEFQWEYAGTIAERRITLYYAMSAYNLSRYHRQEGNHSQADEYESRAQSGFNNVVQFAERLPNYGPRQQNVIRSLVMEGYYHWARTLNQNNQFERAIEVTENALALDEEIIPNMMSIGEGRGMMIERAKALFQTAGRQQAMEIANEVADRGGTWGARAQRLVSEWAVLVQQNIGPRTWLNMIDGARRDEQYQRAIHMARRALQNLNSDAENIQYGWRLLERMALAYTNQERWYEAAIAFNEIHERYRDIFGEETPQYDEFLDSDLRERLESMVPRAKYYTARCYSFAFAASDIEDDQQTFSEHVDELQERYPDSRWTAQAQLLGGDMFREGGQYEEAISRYEGSGSEGTEVYEQARARVGVSYYRWGEQLFENGNEEEAQEKFQQSIDVFRNYLDYTENQDPPSEDVRRNLLWQARDFLASAYLHEAINQSQQVLDLFSDIENSRFRVGRIAEGLFFRFRAYRQMGEIGQMEQVANRMDQRYPEQNFTTQALGILADTYHENREQSFENHRKSAEFAFRWAEKRIHADAANRFDVYAMAERIETFADHAREEEEENLAREHFQRALDLYNLLVQGEYGGRSVSLANHPDVPGQRRINRFRARVLTKLGRLDDAASLYEQIASEWDSPSGPFLLEKAKLHYEIFLRRIEEGRDPGDHAGKASQILGKLNNASESGTERWWDIRYMLVRLAEEQNDMNRARSLLQTAMRQGGEDFGGRERFQEAWNRITQ